MGGIQSEVPGLGEAVAQASCHIAEDLDQPVQLIAHRMAGRQVHLEGPGMQTCGGIGELLQFPQGIAAHPPGQEKSQRHQGHPDQQFDGDDFPQLSIGSRSLSAGVFDDFVNGMGHQHQQGCQQGSRIPEIEPGAEFHGRALI